MAWKKAVALWAMCQGWTTSAQGKPLYLLETAPLRNVLGYFGARAEVAEDTNDSLGIEIRSEKKAGALDSQKDFYFSMGLQYLYYLNRIGDSGPYLGIGGIASRRETGRTRHRSYSSSIRYNSNERFDSWIDREDGVSLEGSLGYRYFWNKSLTLSGRYSLDRSLVSTKEVIYSDLKTNYFKPEAQSRPGNIQYVVVHVGFAMK